MNNISQEQWIAEAAVRVRARVRVELARRQIERRRRRALAVVWLCAAGFLASLWAMDGAAWIEPALAWVSLWRWPLLLAGIGALLSLILAGQQPAGGADVLAARSA